MRERSAGDVLVTMAQAMRAAGPLTLCVPQRRYWAVSTGGAVVDARALSVVAEDLTGQYLCDLLIAQIL